MAFSILTFKIRSYRLKNRYQRRPLNSGTHRRTRYRNRGHRRPRNKIKEAFITVYKKSRWFIVCECMCTVYINTFE